MSEQHPLGSPEFGPVEGDVDLNSEALEEFSTGKSARNSKFSMQTILTGVVLVAAVATVYTMRSLGMGAGGVMADIKIDYQLDAAPKSDPARYEKIVADLNQTGPPNQVPSDQIENPFVLEDHSAKAADTGPSDADLWADQAARSAAEQELALQQRQAQIASDLKTLQLHGIMAGGAMPVCRINGKTRFVGSRVGKSFKIKEINKKSVILEADGKEYELRMEKTLGNSGSRRNKR